MKHMRGEPKRLAGLAAVERLQAETRRIYDDIDAQNWSASEKIAHFNKILGVFGSWWLAALPPETRAETMVKMAAGAGRAADGSAPRIFH